jgi:MinD-like ATPase involved in chromosome partitioning or flagellar assembly
MRFAFAVSDLRLPADLASVYDDVELAGAFSAWTDLVGAVRAAGEEPIDVAVLDRELTSGRDRTAGLDLEATLAALRAVSPRLRIVVVARGDLDPAMLARHEAESFLDLDTTTSARNLGKLLGLVDRSAVAKVLMVSGYQGGTGKTTMSRYVATELASRMAGKALPGRRGVLLWELDLAHPTLAFDREFDLLGTDGGRRTISRILNAGPLKVPDDLAKLEASVVARTDSGLPYDVLLAPHGAREVMSVMQAYGDDLVALRDRLRSVLELAKRMYTFIVIDTGTDYISHPGAQIGLESADALCLMSTPTAAGLSALLSLEVIIGDRGLTDRTRVFLNRGKRDDGPYLKACFDVATRVGKGGVLNLIREVEPADLEAAFRPRAAQFLAEFGL